jgi:hypothetical protein
MGCGKEATHALDVNGTLKGFYCMVCASILQKNLPDEVGKRAEEELRGKPVPVVVEKAKVTATESKVVIPVVNTTTVTKVAGPITTPKSSVPVTSKEKK